MTYRDYIWDLGGTLLDNYQRSAQAFRRTLKEYGLPEASHDAVYSSLKQSVAEALERFAPGQAGFLEAYKKNEALDLRDPVLFEGAHEVLAAIQAGGGRNFLWSHRDRQALDILDRAGISGYFTAVITKDQGFPRKPDPAALLFLKQTYQIEQALVIGDREIDLEAGRSAGFATYLFDGRGSLMQILDVE